MSPLKDLECFWVDTIRLLPRFGVGLEKPEYACSHVLASTKNGQTEAEQNDLGFYGIDRGILVIVPESIFAMAARVGGSGIVGPLSMVMVPDAVASLIWLEKCVTIEKPPVRKWFSLEVRTMGFSVPVNGSIAVHVTVTIIVRGLSETRSKPSTVALSDAPVSLLST